MDSKILRLVSGAVGKHFCVWVGLQYKLCDKKYTLKTVIA